MSSYLTIYGKLKPEYKVEKPISLLSVSRNNDLYQAFHESGVAYIYGNAVDISDENPEMQYTEITVEKLNEIRSSLNETIKSTQERIDLIEKNLPEKSSERLEMLQEVLSWKEYLEDNKRTLHEIDFINIMLNEVKYNYSPFEKLLCNVD